MRFIINFFLIIFLSSCGAVKDKTVLVAILARNKAHTLPKYLECIQNLDYSKKAITIYINTNNNMDTTEDILRNWVKENESQYKKIIFESHSAQELTEDESNPHEWNTTRFSVLGRIRNESMHKAIENHCDYYFVADCDNFVKPCTLKKLIEKDKPIIAPMLKTLPAPQSYSNYFCDIDENGYWKSAPFYYQILSKAVKGTFSVPVVHCTYLIKTDQIPELTYADGTVDYEFVIFSRSARNHHVEQFICNEEDFGVLFLPSELGDMDLETETRVFNELAL